MSWDRLRSHTSGSNFKYDFISNQGRTLSRGMLSERGPVPSTIGGQSIQRYAMEHHHPIEEETSQFMNTKENITLNQNSKESFHDDAVSGLDQHLLQPGHWQSH
jgi:hypothetical protein